MQTAMRTQLARGDHGCQMHVEHSLATATHRTAHWNSPMRLSQVSGSSAPHVASVSTPSLRMRAFRGVFLPACTQLTSHDDVVTSISHNHRSCISCRMLYRMQHQCMNNINNCRRSRADMRQHRGVKNGVDHSMNATQPQTYHVGSSAAQQVSLCCWVATQAAGQTCQLPQVHCAAAAAV